MNLSNEQRAFLAGIANAATVVIDGGALGLVAMMHMIDREEGMIDWLNQNRDEMQEAANYIIQKTVGEQN